MTQAVPPSQVHTSAVLCADGAVSAQSSPLLLVRFGAGPYRVLRPPQGKDIGHFLDIDAGMLVKTVRQDETFAVSMERVAQDQCKMLVAVSAQDEEPLAAESAKAVELTGAKTLRKLVGSTPKGHVWIDIQSLAVGALSSKSVLLRLRGGALAGVLDLVPARVDTDDPVYPSLVLQSHPPS